MCVRLKQVYLVGVVLGVVDSRLVFFDVNDTHARTVGLNCEKSAI